MLSQIELLRKYNLRVRGHLGQHLLIDPNTIRKIVDALELKTDDKVLEIGPGLGAVTREVLSRGANLLAIETDAKFVEILTNEILPEYPERFKIIESDILKINLSETMRKWNIKNKLTARREKIKVVSNLPYYISTPILFQLIESGENFSRAILMMQKEVAVRLAARAGSEDYGRLSVTSQYFGEIKTLFDVSQSCFLPKPEVMSRVISYEFKMKFPNDTKEDTEALMKLVKIAFSQRRKTLLSLLLSSKITLLDRPSLEKIFIELGFDIKLRGETLTLDEYRELLKYIQKKSC